MLQTSAHVKILPSIVRTNHHDGRRQGLARETSLALLQVARIAQAGTSPYHDKSRQKEPSLSVQSTAGGRLSEVPLMQKR
jgi:hypothetical protein